MYVSCLWQVGQTVDCCGGGGKYGKLVELFPSKVFSNATASNNIAATKKTIPKIKKSPGDVP